MNTSPRASDRKIWVFHNGALGDSVLLWPMLRHLKHSGSVTLVTDAEKGGLAARELGIAALNTEQRRFSLLWSEHEPGFTGPEPAVDHVVSFLVESQQETWARNARRMFPGATLELHAAPIDRAAALRLAHHEIGPPRHEHPHGPVVVHVGAGAVSKRWPMDRWASLVRGLRASAPVPRHDVCVLAGEVEAERFSTTDRGLFDSIQGRFLSSLDALSGRIREASLFLGNDSGPTHLAAQLGVPTVALFGPTDPSRWAPIGPSVRVIAPSHPTPMTWLGVNAVTSMIPELTTGGPASDDTIGA